MSHYKIFQISTQPISEDDYISPSDFEEECYNDWRDYMDDELTPEEQMEAIEDNDPIFEKFFERKGRELIFKGADEFIKEWIKCAQDTAAKLTPNDSLSFWDLKKISEQSHHERIHLCRHQLLSILKHPVPMTDSVQRSKRPSRMCKLAYLFNYQSSFTF